MEASTTPKQLIWLGSTRADLRAFPQPVRQALGYALYLAQMGEKHLEAKPLKGFGGAGGLEAVDDHAGETYRAVYTVKFAEAVYVLHAFQKKSVRGRATSQRDIDLIKARLQWAQEHYAQWQHAPHTRQR